jgi:hypothetical protein
MGVLAGNQRIEQKARVASWQNNRNEILQPQFRFLIFGQRVRHNRRGVRCSRRWHGRVLRAVAEIRFFGGGKVGVDLFALAIHLFWQHVPPVLLAVIQQQLFILAYFFDGWRGTLVKNKRQMRYGATLTNDGDIRNAQ